MLIQDAERRRRIVWVGASLVVAAVCAYVALLVVLMVALSGGTSG